MDIHEQKEITVKRSYKISKSNYLVQKSRYDLTLAEQRAVAYICTLIKPCIATPANNNVPYKLEYEFDIWEYAKVCGIHSDGGRLYQDTRNLLKGLMIKIMYIELPDGYESMVPWFTEVGTNKRSGKAKVKINEYLVPYLFDLQKNFTAYELINILAMKSQYSIRIYELARSHAYQKVVEYEIDKLKKMLMVDDVKSYNRFPDFRRRILDPAIAEINEYTDLSVGYKPITKGRKVVKVEFHIAKKAPLDRFISQAKTTGKL